MDEELEELKRKKFAELQQRQSEQIKEQQQLQAQIEELETLVKQFLTREALQRYGNLKMAHQEKAVRVLAILGQLIQQGKITTQIDDLQFKNILKKLEPPKKNFNITIK